jgi:hypothetical protein
MAQQTPIVLDSNNDLSRVLSGDTLTPASLGTGTPDADSFLKGDGTWSYLTERGVDTVLFGSQHWGRECEEYDIAIGSLTAASGLITAAMTQSNQTCINSLIHCYPYTAGSNSLDVLYLWGYTNARVSATSVRFNYPSAPNGTSTNAYKVILGQRLGQFSAFAEMQKLIGSPFRLAGNFSTTFSTTDMLTLFTNIVLPTLPEVVIGDFGMRTDIIAGVATATILANLISMLTLCLNRRLLVLFEIPVPWSTMTATQVAVMSNLGKALQRWFAANSRGSLKIVDASAFGTNGGDGTGTPACASNGDALTYNNLTNRARGLFLAERASEWGLQPLSIGPANSNDRYGVSTESSNIYDGGFSATGSTPTDTNATGTIDSESTVVTSGAASRAIACSLVQRQDLLGSYDNVYALSATATSSASLFTFKFGGATALHPMAPRLVAGATYQASLEIYLVSAANLDYIEINVEGSNTYSATSLFARYSSAYGIYGLPAITTGAESYSGGFCGEVVIPEFTLPTAVSYDEIYVNVIMRFANTFTASLKIGRVAMRRVA